MRLACEHIIPPTKYELEIKKSTWSSLAEVKNLPCSKLNKNVTQDAGNDNSSHHHFPGTHAETAEETTYINNISNKNI